MRWAAVIFLAFVILASRIVVSASWPATCDPHADHRFELFTAYRCSSHLLSGGGLEIAAFIFLWALPIGALGLILYYRQRKNAEAGQIPVE